MRSRSSLVIGMLDHVTLVKSSARIVTRPGGGPPVYELTNSWSAGKISGVLIGPGGSSAHPTARTITNSALRMGP